jgi:hypothetical protein
VRLAEEARENLSFDKKMDLINSKGINRDLGKSQPDKIDELDPESRLFLNKAETDYKNGKIDKATYDSIKSGILNTGAAFIKNAIENKVTQETSERIANEINIWIRENTAHFMDRGLLGATVGGGVAIIPEPPSLLSKVIRSGAVNAVPIIGAVLDFSVQVSRGEVVTDAAVKTVGHIGAGAAGATIGTAIGGPIGTVVGFIVGVAGSMLFDAVYDNKEKIASQISNIVDSAEDTGKSAIKLVTDKGKEVGDAVSGFFGNLSTAFC